MPKYCPYCGSKNTKYTGFVADGSTLRFCPDCNTKYSLQKENEVEDFG